MSLRAPLLIMANEGEVRPRWTLIRGYQPGWDGFTAMLEQWRAAGRLEGSELDRTARKGDGR